MDLETSFSINTDLVMSTEELLANYLFGVNLNAENQQFPNEYLEFYIKAAMDEIESTFNLKLIRQIVTETRDYRVEDYNTFGYLRLSYPCVKAISLVGKFGDTEQISYPKEWLSTKRSSEEPAMYWRNLHILPNVGGTTNSHGSAGVTFNGIFGANLLWRSRQYIPNYWHVRYLTGFEKIPSDLLNVLGKIAAKNILHIAGDIILGSAGIASYSLSLDGLSQSISTTSSATNAGYGARITQYNEEIKTIMPILQQKYRGFSIAAL